MPTDRIHPRRNEPSDMSADMIASRRFAQSWRGFDAEEVKQFLSQVAAQVRMLREKYEQSEASRREAEQRASHPEIDEAVLMSAVGEETAGILRSARSAAAEITSKAEARAQEVIAAAEAKAAELVGYSESLLATRSAEADRLANDIKEQAIAEADQARELARQQATAINEDAVRSSEETVRAAQAIRERILTDLARRRKLGSVQVEQLRAGRERLLDAYLVVRRTLDEVTDELQRADAEARAASVAVGRQHGLGPDELAELKAEEIFHLPAPSAAEEAAHEAAETVPVPKTTAKLPPPQEPLKLAGADREKLPPAAARPTSNLAPTAVISRSDSIESVRLLRPEPSQTPPGAAGEPPSSAPSKAKGQDGAEHDRDEAVTPDMSKVNGQSEPEEQGGEAGRPSIATAGAPTQAEEGAAGRDLQGLFARLRAGRAEAATNARKTLYEPAEVEEDIPAAPGEELAKPVPDAMTDFFEQCEEISQRLSNSLARKLKRALQDEQNSLLDKLRNLKTVATPSAVLPSVEEQPDRFVEAGRPILEEAARAGGGVAAAVYGLGSPSDLSPEAVDDVAEELGRMVTEPLRQRLEHAFASSSEDASDVAEALGPAYREWKTHRIEAIARDQVATAFHRGAYSAFPQESMVRWVPTEKVGPCPDCEDNTLAGWQKKGEAWPTGQLHPPAHSGCSCALAPTRNEAARPPASNGPAQAPEADRAR